jgi:RNA polymerase-binding transcription factor DksA
LASSAAAALKAVDAALDRLAAGRYGWDGAAGAWIPADRLRALPGALHSLPASMEFV